jgi:hypothetical protein
LAGIGFLTSLAYVAFMIYLAVLLTRATSALEKMASALASKSGTEDKR